MSVVLQRGIRRHWLMARSRIQGSRAMGSSRVECCVRRPYPSLDDIVTGRCPVLTRWPRRAAAAARQVSVFRRDVAEHC